MLEDMVVRKLYLEERLVSLGQEWDELEDDFRLVKQEYSEVVDELCQLEQEIKEETNV